MKLDQSCILITGGGGGIATAIARELLTAGAAVMLADRDSAALERAEAALDGGERVTTVVADLLQTADLDRLVAQAQVWRGGINVLVNAAGVNHFGLFDDQSPQSIEQTMAINVTAPLLLCQRLLPHLRQQPSASILNIGSAFGCIGYPGYAAYCASKFAVRGFTEALRRELADTSVSCQCLAPRATRTRINSSAVDAMNEELGNAVDSPEVVAHAVRVSLEKDRGFAVLGWPEKLFARINGLLPGLVESALVRQLPVIKRYARSGSAAPAIPDNAMRRTTS
jgi:short-subunit dehydrogenase